MVPAAWRYCSAMTVIFFPQKKLDQPSKFSSFQGRLENFNAVNIVPTDAPAGASSGLDSCQRFNLKYGQHPAFWFNLKGSSWAPSISVPSSHTNLAHVVGAMIVADTRNQMWGRS